MVDQDDIFGSFMMVCWIFFCSITAQNVAYMSFLMNTTVQVFVSFALIYFTLSYDLNSFGMQTKRVFVCFVVHIAVFIKACLFTVMNVGKWDEFVQISRNCSYLAQRHRKHKMHVFHKHLFNILAIQGEYMSHATHCLTATTATATAIAYT